MSSIATIRCDICGKTVLGDTLPRDWAFLVWNDQSKVRDGVRRFDLCEKDKEAFAKLLDPRSPAAVEAITP